ncbi:TCP-1/cpn60 chaperonin family protein [Candidatus Woesearchaeota archaeon]|nr:TCP-1/cpn60 chaperonin family protein [Candidatus Woesearchaeota archaeon]
MSQQDTNANDYLLAEGTKRDQGRTAQRMNILAAKLVAETVRTTLGPQGMDKMIVNSLGDATITNDGATILKEMNIEHPTAKMIVEIAKTQEDEVGDGTTTAVVLAGEFLKKAEELLEQGIHPTVIIKGYRQAAKIAQKILLNMSEMITEKDTTTLNKLAMTAMTGKVAEGAKEHLASIVVKALQKIKEEEDINIDNVKLEKKVGSSVEETELIEGVVIDKEKVHAGMPTSVKNAKIALIDSPLEMRRTETDARISITDPDKLQAFLDMEENMLKKIVDTITKTGASVVFCQKGVDEVVQYLLAQRGIYTCRRVKKSDMKNIARATGGNIISNVNDLQKDHLGKAGLVEEVKVGDEEMTFVRDCKNPKAVTILVRATTEHTADEVNRALDDALGNVASALRAHRVVGGAGATETELTRNLQHFGQKVSGKEQLAILAFAKAIEVIPKTLAENAGLDAINIISDLNAAHDKGKKWAGVNVFNGKIIDAFKEGIVEPLPIKTQAIASASEVAVLILRIDDVIVAGVPEQSSRGNPGEGFE